MKILTRREAETDWSFGFDPYKRPIEEHIRNGIVILDKPRGPTSHQVTAWVKRILKLKKAGHGGTLDPAVTGVLPIFLENAVKVQRVLTYGDKEYICLAKFHRDVDDETLHHLLKRWKGEIIQIPPVRSKVKRIPRKRIIYELELLEREGRYVLLRVACQAGTYVRKLIHDMGKEVGGAHMVELRRIRAGCFMEDECVTLQDLEDAYAFYVEDGEERYLRECIKPVEEITRMLKKVWILDTAVDAICNGAKLSVRGISKVEDGIEKGDLIAILTLKGELVALGRAEMGSASMLSASSGIAASLERVVMKKGTYPSFWKRKPRVSKSS